MITIGASPLRPASLVCQNYSPFSYLSIRGSIIVAESRSVMVSWQREELSSCYWRANSKSSRSSASRRNALRPLASGFQFHSDRNECKSERREERERALELIMQSIVAAASGLGEAWSQNTAGHSRCDSIELEIVATYCWCGLRATSQVAQGSGNLAACRPPLVFGRARLAPASARRQ